MLTLLDYVSCQMYLAHFCNKSYMPSFAMQKGVVDTQLIAHDKEVYDIAWGGVGVFASVSADGSVRVFDLRYGAHQKHPFGNSVLSCASVDACLTLQYQRSLFTSPIGC